MFWSLLMWVALGVVALALAATVFIAYELVQLKRSPLAKIPAPPCHPILGNIPDMKAANSRPKRMASLAVDWLAKGLIPRDISTFRVFFKINVRVADPELVRNILVQGQNNYRNQSFERAHALYDTYAAVFGLALQNARLDQWKWRRNVMVPIFSNRNVNTVILPFVLQQSLLLVDWLSRKVDPKRQHEPVLPEAMAFERANQLSAKTHPREPGAVYLDAVFVQFTMRVIVYYLFGDQVNFTEDADSTITDLVDAISELENALIAYFRNPLANLMPWLQLHKRKRAAWNVIDSFTRPKIQHLIKLARMHEAAGIAADAEHKFYGAVYDMARADPRYDVETVVGEMRGLLLAGHDTTAHTMAFGAGLLIENPEALGRLRKDVQQLWGSDVNRSDNINAQSLSQLTYMAAIVNETLRVCPIVPSLPITCVRETTLKGYTIPAGSDLSIDFLTLTRDPVLYPQPEKFIPERFIVSAEALLEDSTATRITNLAFSAGPHQCLGKNLAMMEARVLLSLLFRKFDMRLAQGYKLDSYSRNNMLLSPVEELPVMVSLRA